MEGEGMVAVVRGLRDAGLAVTLMDGNRQYTLLPNSITQPPQARLTQNTNASTQQTQKRTADSSTESTMPLCDSHVQAVDGRYTSMYKAAHCNVRPTSPPVQLTEFPPQRPEVYPGHGNFQVGGTGSGATNSPIRASSPVSFRGGMSWPDRGSVCSPRSSHEVDAFANSLRKYPCLSPDRSTEVIERLINYTQAKGLSRNFSRNSTSPTRLAEHSSHHTLEPKSTYTTRTPRYYEPEITIRTKKLEDPPTRDKKNEHDHMRTMRNFDVRCVRDMSKRLRESVKVTSTYPYNHPVSPTIKEYHDYQSLDHQNGSSSVNMEIQAAVKMISKEVATVQRDHFTRKSVAVPDSPSLSPGEDNVEGECYFVPNLDINTSFKSIQTTFCPSDVTLKPRKSAQTVSSNIDFNAKHRNKFTVCRKTKSQEEIKVTKDDLKRSLLELIEEVSTSTNKTIIHDELIKKLFDTGRSDREHNKSDKRNTKRDKCHKYVSTFCPSGCDYVGDFQELVGKLKHCYGDTKHVLYTEIKPFRISEYRQLDFVLKEWINNLNLKTKEGRYIDRGEILSTVEDRIKEIFKNRTKQDFDLKSGIVKIIEEIPIEVNKSYNRKNYLTKLVDLLLKRMRNVIVSHNNGRIRRKSPANRSKKILTEEDIRDFVRAHLLDFFLEYNLDICDEMLDDLENELIYVMIDSIDCIRCGHIDDASEEMVMILQDIGQSSHKQAHFLTNLILQDLKEMLGNCNFNQTYMILHSNVNSSGQTTNTTNDFSIGGITESDLNANLDQYTNQLCLYINEWLDNLKIPQIKDRGFREVIVNDLAGDIVDRHKYLELNPNIRGTDEEELETLKYQIFKWVNKLVGEENQETIGHAKELQQKINTVTVPMLTNPQTWKINRSGAPGPGQQQQNVDSMRLNLPRAGGQQQQPQSFDPMTLNPSAVGGQQQQQPQSYDPMSLNSPKTGGHQQQQQSLDPMTLNSSGAGGHQQQQSFDPMSLNSPETGGQQQQPQSFDSMSLNSSEAGVQQQQQQSFDPMSLNSSEVGDQRQQQSFDPMSLNSSEEGGQQQQKSVDPMSLNSSEAGVQQQQQQSFDPMSLNPSEVGDQRQQQSFDPMSLNSSEEGGQQQQKSFDPMSLNSPETGGQQQQQQSFDPMSLNSSVEGDYQQQQQSFDPMSLNSSGAGGQQQPYDPMRPCLGETGPNTCQEENLKLMKAMVCRGPCNVQGQVKQGDSESYSPTDQTSQSSDQTGPVSMSTPDRQGSQGSYPYAGHITESPIGRQSTSAQGSQGPYSSHPTAGQTSQSPTEHPTTSTGLAGSPGHPGLYPSGQTSQSPTGRQSIFAPGSQGPLGPYSPTGQTLRSPGGRVSITPGSQVIPGSYSSTDQTSQSPTGRFSISTPGSPSHPGPYSPPGQTTQGSIGRPSISAPGSPDHPGSYPPGQTSQSPTGHQPISALGSQGPLRPYSPTGQTLKSPGGRVSIAPGSQGLPGQYSPTDLVSQSPKGRQSISAPGSQGPLGSYSPAGQTLKSPGGRVSIAPVRQGLPESYSPTGQTSQNPTGPSSKSTPGSTSYQSSHPGSYTPTGQITQGPIELPSISAAGSPGHPGSYSPAGQSTQGPTGRPTISAPGSPGHTGSYSPTGETTQGPTGRPSISVPGSPGHPGSYSPTGQSTQGLIGLPSILAPGSPGHPGSYSPAGQTTHSPTGRPSISALGSPSHPGSYSPTAQTTRSSAGRPSISAPGTQGTPVSHLYADQTTQSPTGRPSISVRGGPGHPGAYSPTDDKVNGHYSHPGPQGQFTQSTYGQGGQGVQDFGPAPYGQLSPHVQGGQIPQHRTATQGHLPQGPYAEGFQNVQGIPVPYNQGQHFGPVQSPYGQGSPYIQGSLGTADFGPVGTMFSPNQSQDPNQQWTGPAAFSQGPTHGMIPMYEIGSAGPISRGMSSPGGVSMHPNQQTTYDPNHQSMSGTGPSSMMGAPQGTQVPLITGSFAPKQVRGDLYSPGSGAGTSHYASQQMTSSAISPYQDSSALIPTSLRQLNEEYDDYLQQWVHQIPIAVATPAEQQSAEKVRQGIYNGIWKAVTKMKLDNDIFSNPYFYQDVFDEEIEALLKNLPKTQELEDTKQSLKAQLLEKTVAMNDLIRSTNAPASFKKQLTENIENNLPKRKSVNEDITNQQNEEVQKLNLAEYYMLYTRYKDEDSLKANVHKKTFLNKLEEFLDTIRKNRDVDMDTNAYANEIINSLDKIPIPNIHSVRDEADDILLGMEVENWMSDLPLKSDNTGNLPLEKRRIRHAIVKKIQELGTIVDYADSSFSTPLKKELPKYLEKIPIQEGTNIDFMIEELANRIKNASRYIRQKSVSFQDQLNYSDFSRNMPASSSFTEPGGRENTFRGTGPQSWASDQGSVPQEEQWHSMEATLAPQGFLNWSQGIDSQQSQPYSQNISGQMTIPGSYPGEVSHSKAIPGSYGAQSKAYNAQGSPASAGQESTRGPCCSNPACTNRPDLLTQGSPGSYSHTAAYTQSPRGPFGQSFPNVQGSPIPYNQGQSFASSPYSQVIPNMQGSPGALINAAKISQAPQVPYYQGLPNAHGNLGPYNQSAGPASMHFSKVPQNMQGGSLPVSQMHSQGPHGAGPIQVSQEPFGQSFPNVQSSPVQYNQSQNFVSGPYGLVGPGIQGGSVPLNLIPSQGPNAIHPSHVPQGPYDRTFTNMHGEVPIPESFNQGQSFGSQAPYGQVLPANGQSRAIPASQMSNAAPVGHFQQVPYGQITPNIQDSSVPGGQLHSRGPNTLQIGQVYQGPYRQVSSNIQDSSVPGAQMHTQQPNSLQTGQVYQGPYGQVSPNIQDNSVPGGQIHPQRPNESQMGQVYQGPYGPTSPNAQGSPTHPGQVFPSGPAYYDQGYSNGQPSFNASAEVQSNMQSPRQNQTAQSSGPISAASQVPDSRSGSHKPNLQQMADGGMGLLGTSQEPGPSRQTVSPQTAQSSPTERYLISGAPPFYAGTTDTSPPGFHKSTDSKEQQLTCRKCRTVPKEKLAKGFKNDEIKPFEINEREVFNIKSVQTAFSTIDIKTTKCKYCEIGSKSQEELTKITKTQEFIKKKDLGWGDLQQEVTEWFEIHSDKVKVKLWGEKMQKLAEKLKKPGGEEKLRIKIEKYLKKVPDQFSEGDDERLEFRKQLPHDIIRKLKKMYLKPTDTNISVYRMELSKYCSRFKTENFRKVIMNWMKTLNLKKKDFLGRNVKKDDIFTYVADTLEPLVLDRPKSDSEYRIALKSKITDIVDDLPLVLGNHNKEYKVNKVTDTLVEEIFNIESKVPSTYIQPTIREIKEFVKDETTFFLEKSRVAISTKRMEYLETELIDLLLDLTDIVDIDNYVVEDVTNILKDIGKLPEYKAKYFSNLLLKDYKEFFFRESFFQEKGNSNHGRPDVFSVFQNASDLVNLNATTTFDVYTQRLVEEIRHWIPKINILNKDKNFIEATVKDLASDIVDRYKYLILNSNMKGTDAEEFEHLKYQIFKFTNKLVGEETKEVLEHTQELMNRINNIPKPNLPGSSVSQSIPQQSADVRCDTKSYIDKLTDEIYNWFHDLPIDLRLSQEASLNKQLIKDLAEVIEKSHKSKKDEGVIDREVGKWTKKVFNNKLNCHNVNQLKNKIKSVAYTQEKVEIDSKQEKTLIRSYEDLVDEWIDTVTIEPKKEAIFTNNRNEYIHDLAVKIHNTKSRLNGLSAEKIQKKLQQGISDWMKKLPVHQQVDIQKYRDKYAAKLVQNIQTYKINYSVEEQLIKTNQEFAADQLERAILEWLKKLPLYKNKNSKDKENQEVIVKELAYRINVAINDYHSDPDDDIIECIRMLDPTQYGEFVQKTALHLKSYLQELNLFGDLSQRRDAENDFIVRNIEVWINNLPLDITDVSRFENQKTDFIRSIKRLRFSGSDSAVFKKGILTFMKTLPMDRKMKKNMRYLDEEASKLMQSLIEPIEDVRRQLAIESNEIISNIIIDWINILPLKPVHNPRELHSLINDMSSVITTFLLHPEYSKTEENYLRLNRAIIKFLRRFPLQQEVSEGQILQMAEELIKTLKDVHLFRNDNFGGNNVTVYGVSLQTTNTTDNDFSIRSLQEIDINANLDAYTKQLILQIGEWFDNLNLPNMQKEVFKDVVINDLAGDIVDRHKYLELNPECKSTPQDELEHLKYQIFKWINKLVGEENLETIEHADDLMQRIQRIPVPMLVRPQDRGQTGLYSPLLTGQQGNISQSISPVNRPGSWQKVNEHQTHGSPAGAINLSESPLTPQMIPSPQSKTSKRISNPDTTANQNTINSPAGERNFRESPQTPSSANSRKISSPAASANETTGSSAVGRSYREPSLIPPATPQSTNSRRMSSSVASANITTGSSAGGESLIETPPTPQSPPTTTTNKISSPAALAIPGINGSPASGGMRESPQPTASSRLSSSVASSTSKSTKCCSQDLPPPSPPPEEGTKEAIYEKFQKIFRQKCNALPIDTSTPENAKLAELAKTGIYNGIIKKFFMLKSDPEIENDYGYFEFMLEEKLEEMLNILPQTQEVINMRHAWKLDILANATDMLDQLHSLSDRPSFRQRVRNKFNRKFARDLELEECFVLQQGFLAEVADAYILETNYKEKDPMKASIYKHRLMNKIDDLANHLSKEHNVGFRFFKKAQLVRIALKVLEQVPIPDNDILQEEAEEIQLADEVEKWYNELPTKPYINNTDTILRKRMMDLLAKRLYDIHKRVNDKDPSKEAKMKHEMSQFLEKRAMLQQDQDLNINFMVEQLNNRLKNRLLKEPVDYDAFEKHNPLSSTFAQVENHEFLAPLMDAATSTVPLQGQVFHSSNGGPNQSNFPQPGHGQIMGQSHILPRTSHYVDKVNTSQIRPSQGYISHSIQGSGQGGMPSGANPYADNLDMSHQGPGQGYISHLEAPMHSMAVGPNPPRPPYGQAGSSGGYISQQNAPIHSMGQVARTPMSMPGVLLETSQFGPKQGQPRTNMSQAPTQQARTSQGASPYISHFVGSPVEPGQIFVTQKGMPTQGMAHTSPKGTRGLRTSHIASSPRMQNINQSLEQHLVASQEPQEQHIPGSYGGQGQIQFVPSLGIPPTDVPGYLGSNGPTPGQGTATTAEAGGRIPVESIEMMDDYQLRCRCLEAYRKRRRCFEYDERYPRYNPYGCPY